MPMVARVDGIKIAEHEAMIGIDTLKVLEGYLPRPQLRKVVVWAKPRRALLREAWDACQADRNPGKIP